MTINGPFLHLQPWYDLSPAAAEALDETWHVDNRDAVELHGAPGVIPRRFRAVGEYTACVRQPAPRGGG